MTEIMVKGPYERLRECTEYDAVDAILDEIGFPGEAIDKRLLFLYDIMGVKQLFCSNRMEIEEEYASAKEELTSQAWRDFN